MTFDRVRDEGDWELNSVVDQAEWEQWDTNQSQAVDGHGGGTYAPSTAIIIGGSGLRVTGTFQTSGTTILNNGVTVQTAGVFACTVPGAFGAGLSVQGTGNFLCSRPSSFSNTLALTGVTTVTGGSATLGVSGGASFGCDGAAAFNQGMTVLGDSFHTGVITLYGTGKIGWRYTAIGDASATVGVDAYDEVRLPQSVSTPRTLTISNAGAVAGSRLRVTRDYSTSGAASSTTNGFLLKANAAAMQFLVGSGSAERNWVDLTYDGGAWFVSAEDRNA